jgi:polysaccharide biosynthesis/export protein
MKEPRRREGSRRRRMGGAMCAMAVVASGCFASRRDPGLEQREAAAPAHYEIGADDTLDIVVWREEKVSGPVQVRPDGMITIPLLGDVLAAGQTPEQLAENLRQGLARYIDSPNVVVRVVTMGSRRFFVIGNVPKPGMYDMRPNQTFLQAVAMAGGFTDFAKRGSVRIVRNGGGAPVEPDYDAISRGEAPDILLEPNDTIIVP